MNNQVTLKWSWQLGAVIRGDIKRNVMSACFQLGLDLEIKEDKGMISSLYLFKVKGAKPQVKRLLSLVRHIEKEMADET